MAGVAISNQNSVNLEPPIPCTESRFSGPRKGVRRTRTEIFLIILIFLLVSYICFLFFLFFFHFFSDCFGTRKTAVKRGRGPKGMMGVIWRKARFLTKIL